MERENRSIGGGKGESILSLWGKGDERVAEGRGDCLVQRKRLDCFREGAKGTELERSLFEEDGVFHG